MMPKFLLFALALTVISTPAATAAPDDTPDWWNCPNRTSGEWKFGRAPDVCDMDSFIDLDYVDNEFNEFVFEDTASRDEERLRYMSETHALISDVANYYFNKRNPGASVEELEIFLRSSLTIGHQESFWTHYRRPSHGKVQFMRSGGDYGHGHGIFQVDDRWHFPAVLDGRAANIVMNMVYSLEEYYHAWETAPSMNCSSEDDYISRARSAYSAYNGGLKRICRWTNPNDRWARNDKGWWSKYNRKEWESYVEDPSRNSNVDIDCIVQGNEGCRRDIGDDPTPVVGKIYKSSQSKFCSFKNENFECVSSLKDSSCLALKGGDDFSNYRGRFRKMPTHFEDEYSFNDLDRHELCQEYSENLFTVGKSINVNKNINLRSTPGGAWKVTIPSGSVVQILDFVLKDISKQQRYYKVKYKGFIGYIFAGSKDESNQWASLSNEKSPYRLIAHMEDKIKVENEQGEKIYNLEGEVTRVAPLNEVFEVQYISISGDMNKVTYEVGENEIVKAGMSGDLLNLSDKFSVVIKNRAPARVLAKFKNSTWWKRLRVCPSSKCKKKGSIKGPRLSKKKFYVLEEKGSWGLIEQGSKKGWVKRKYIRKL
jgi:hypothetical protein